LEKLRINEEEAAKRAERAVMQIFQESYQQILRDQPAEEAKVIDALLNGQAHFGVAVSFQVAKNFLGSWPWLSVAAKKTVFALLGHVPSEPTAEPAPP
jgi:hypothetical protein